MAQTYTWHSGSQCLNSQWVVPVSLLADELFSSWLIRAALTQGCDPLVLSGNLWPKWRAWVRDIDRGISPLQLELLSKETGIKKKRFEASTLHHIASKISKGALNEKSTWPWILALGTRNRKRYGGLQYCPSCLAHDVIPYYRLQWRFAWHTACSHCGCQLLDRCPHCHAVLEPHRLLAIHVNVAFCASCYSDLRDIDSLMPWDNALNFQKTTDLCVLEDRGYYDKYYLKTNEWFYLIRYFIRLLRKSTIVKTNNISLFLNYLNINIENIKSPVTGLPFELLPINERIIFLQNAWKLMTISENDFLDAAKAARITVQSLKESKNNLPTCLENIAHQLPNKKISRKRISKKKNHIPRSRQDVMRMWARLQRKL